jgi:hypothetical protein
MQSRGSCCDRKSGLPSEAAYAKVRMTYRTSSMELGLAAVICVWLKELEIDTFLKLEILNIESIELTANLRHETRTVS